MAQTAPLIALLGAPAIVEGNQSRPLRASEKTIALLALLVCHADRPISRSWLASKLWPDVDEGEARTNLRRHLYLLAKALPPLEKQCVILRKNTAQWDREAGCRCDVVEFTQAVAARDYDAAVALYGGPLCIGLFDDVVLEQRERMQRLYVDLLRERIDAHDPQSDSAKRLMLLERLTAQDPLNEAWVRDLARARLEAGDRAGARRELSALASRLRSELGVEPDEETARMLTACMEHEHGRVPGNLPVEHTSLVGREAALAELSSHLQSSKWVTIMGPGGIGKTRLAIHTVRNHAMQFSDGTWFVDLASVTAWDDALRRIAATLSLTVESDAVSALRQYLARRRILLVLDNLEQLDDAAADGIAELVRDTATRVLGTSRRRLGGESEAVYTLEQLVLPPENLSPADVLHYSAARLFVDRAVAVAPSFAVSHENAAHIASIVRRLDGLPLAIELVAARANLLTIEGIAKRVHDFDAFRQKGRDGRHQTVTAAIRWSYDLLSHREQVLLQRLAVFEGPFDLAAIESVCADEAQLPPSAIFTVLSELVEASLVFAAGSEGAEQRYALLETVRRFVLTLLGKGAAPFQEAHARFFARRAFDAERAYEELGTAQYVGLMRRDEANIEAALRFAWEKRDAVLLGALVASLIRLWPPMETKRRAPLFEFLAQSDELNSQDPEFHARVLTALAAYASTESQWPRCKELRERAAALWRSAGNEAEALMLDAMVAYTDNYLGTSLADVTVPDLYRIAARLEQIGAPAWHLARIQFNLANMELHLGNIDAALSLVLTALAVARRERRTNYLANALATLTRIYLIQNEITLAERCVEEALEITEDPSYAVLRAQTLGDRGRILLAKDRPLEALRSCAESLEMFTGAFELRFVMRTLGIAMEAMLALGFAERAARIGGYAVSAGESTGSVMLVTTFRESTAYRKAQAALGDAFDGWAQLGATFTYEDMCAEVAAAIQDASRTIGSL